MYLISIVILQGWWQRHFLLLFWGTIEENGGNDRQANEKQE